MKIKAMLGLGVGVGIGVGTSAKKRTSSATVRQSLLSSQLGTPTMLNATTNNTAFVPGGSYVNGA